MTTWNPADCSSDIALSNGNLTATQGAVADWRGVRATASKTSGKWWFQVKIELAVGSGGSAYWGVGFANATQSLSAYLGNAGGNSGGYYPQLGAWGFNDSFPADFPFAVVDDIIGVGINIEGGTVSINVNDGSWTTNAKSFPATLFPAWVGLDNGISPQATVDFTASLGGSPPDGTYSAWDTPPVVETKILHVVSGIMRW